MTSDEQLRELIEKEEAQRKERIARAVERGGLPAEAELFELEDHLQSAFSVAESLEMSVRSISESDDGSELPSPITFEQIGIVAVIADELEERGSEFVDFAKKMRERLRHLEMIRREQEAEEIVRDA